MQRLPVRLIAALTALTIPATAFAVADIVVSEVYFDVAPGDHQIVEICNIGTSDQDITDWWYCSYAGGGTVCHQLTGLADPILSPDDYLRIHLNVAGTNTATDYYIPSGIASLVVAGDEVAIYATGQFADPGAIRAYLKWGSAPAGRESVAVAAGIWFGGSIMIDTLLAGESIVFRVNAPYKFNPADYRVTNTPNLGYPDHPLNSVNSAGNTNVDNLIGLIDVTSLLQALLGLPTDDVTSPLGSVGPATPFTLGIDDVMFVGQKLWRHRVNLIVDDPPVIATAFEPAGGITYYFSFTPVSWSISSNVTGLSYINDLEVDSTLNPSDFQNIYSPLNSEVTTTYHNGEFLGLDPGVTDVTLTMDFYDSESPLALVTSNVISPMDLIVFP